MQKLRLHKIVSVHANLHHLIYNGVIDIVFLSIFIVNFEKVNTNSE